MSNREIYLKRLKTMQATASKIKPAPKSMVEALAIEQFKNGKKELAEVYKAHRDEFVSWAMSQYQCSSEEARDIYHASIIIFYDNIVKEKLQHLNGSVKTYLFAIGKNKIMELRRGDKKNASE